MEFAQPVLIVGGVALAMLALERVLPGRAWPDVTGWLPRAVLLNAAQVASVFVAGVTWDRWFPRGAPWDASGLGTVGGALAAYLALTFVYYWWHRARHEVPLLWRWLHQVHHSPQRLEVLTSFYKHPLEIVANGALSSLVVYGLVGVGPAAGALAVTLTGLAELFYHWNVRTPRWLGWFVQRPESHCVHHRRDWHRQNYSDLPLWDWLFGTLCNPLESKFECGFAPPLERRLAAMLLGRTVTTRRTNEGA